MVPGYNTDFKYRGETYHVQTEDNGVANPVIVSLLYHKGAILASRRTSYQDLLDRPGFEQELIALMKSQHKDLMRDLLAGSFDRNGTAPAIAGGSGEHPADAAAAVATSLPAAAPGPPLEPARPASPPVPASARLALDQAESPPPAAPTLDEAIWSYLKEFAAAAATGAR